uniref:Uncharacterized protein n=1 Tax=Tetradesmus obliquus TaxID=3088 RepID=A0A383VDT0_TETOB|eukprot:jgi/Sobl393_1/6525/SZX62536.1
MLPCDALLLPLLLTAVELAHLQPSRSHAVVPQALSFIMTLFNPHREHAAAAAATGSSSSAAAAALADALAEPVLLAPAVMQYLREGTGGPAGGSQASRAAADKVAEMVAGNYMVLLVDVMQHIGAVLEAAIRLAACATAQMQAMQPTVRAAVVGFIQTVALSHTASQAQAAQPAAADLASWQPALLLSILKTAGKHLKDSTRPALAVLSEAMLVSALASVASGQSITCSRAIAPAGHDRDGSLQLLLAGRALHVAACALLQLHEGPAVPATAHLQQQQQQQQQEDAALVENAPRMLTVMVSCVADIGCLLPAAPGGSSAGGTPQHIADLQRLQHHVQQQVEASVAPVLAD